MWYSKTFFNLVYPKVQNLKTLKVFQQNQDVDDTDGISTDGPVFEED